MRIPLVDFDWSELRVEHLETMLVLKLQMVLLYKFSCMFQIYDEYSVILDSEDLLLDISMNETQIVQILNGLYHLHDDLLNTLLTKDVLSHLVPFQWLVNVLKDYVAVFVSKLTIA